MPASITAKVALGVGVFLTFLVAVASQALYGVTVTSRAVGALTQVTLPQATLEDAFELHALRAVTDISSLLHQPAPEEFAAAQAQIDLAQQAIDELEPLLAAAGDAVARADQQRRRALLADVRDLLAEAGRPAASPDGRQATMEAIEADLDALVMVQHERLTRQIEEQGATATAPVFAARIAAPVGFSLIGLAAIIAAWMFHRTIVKPIRGLAQVATSIGEGHLDQPISADGVDEIGELQRALRQMAINLHEREQAILARTEQILAHQRVELLLTQERDAAEAASRAKSAFLSTMSHELRTPLTAIIGYSQLIEQMVELGSYESVAADVRHISAAGQHLLALINDVLDISRIEAGKLPAEIHDVDICDMLQSVMLTMTPLVEQNRNALRLICPPEIGRMRTDATKVRQALLNLLGNAAKFTEGGAISLSVSAAQVGPTPGVAFQVADTGIGIEAHHMAKLFKPFSQVDDSLSRRYGGTGLGLALSQGLCRLLGGEISVESAFGVGSTFTMWLPRDSSQALSAAEPPGPPHNGAYV